MANLFENESLESNTSQPLAARMRPRTLDEFAGQQHIVGEGSVLRRAIETDAIPSMILYGPPGCGKTTLATIIKHASASAFEPISAVTAGVADIRQVIARAKERRSMYGTSTILFVDEIHRFNKAQQDALLPHVEDGTCVLIGATTENPYFEVNTPLLSRSRVFQFEPIPEDAMRELVERSLQDKERGLGEWKVTIDDDAMQHLTSTSGGDGRVALNALEVAAIHAREENPDAPFINNKTMEDALQRKLLDYDRAGDNHYDTISAFIKSMRGSDPDAAVYWLARMVASGEDPRFIARRIVIQAAEDVGNADPIALVVATAAAQAVEYVGMPEAQIPLAQAAVYIACAPKSNASYKAIHQAVQDVKDGKIGKVPSHLKSAGYKGAENLGSGVGYRYPHDFPGNIVRQNYFPENVKAQQYYLPTGNGSERKIRERLEFWKEELAKREAGQTGTQDNDHKDEQ